jgi:hypothetical protein
MSVKEELQAEIVQTQKSFHRLLEEIRDDAFALPSDNPAWTIGEVCYHMSLAPRMLVTDLRIILGQPILAKVFTFLVPAALFHRLNEFLTRRGARGLNRASLAHAYDKAHTRALQALMPLSETDLQKSLPYPGYDPILSGNVTVEQLFRYVRLHFESHEKQIREIVGRILV